MAGGSAFSDFSDFFKLPNLNLSEYQLREKLGLDRGANCGLFYHKSIDHLVLIKE
jgi:hypothetical protein